MKYRMFSAMLLASALSLFSVGATAQHEEHHAQDQTTQDQSKPGMNGGTTGQGMMSQQDMGSVIGMMSQMRTHHQQMSELMNKLMESMEAIQNEKDPAAAKAKLAEHGALLKEMHDQMMEQRTTMQGMSGMIMKSCPMAGGDPGQTPPSK